MSTLTYQIEEEIDRDSYSLFVSSGTPDFRHGKTGDLWFCCLNSGDVVQAYDQRKSTKRNKISRYRGQLILKKGFGWEEQNATPASACSDIPHPVREKWRLNTETFSWRNTSSVRNFKRAKARRGDQSAPAYAPAPLPFPIVPAASTAARTPPNPHNTWISHLIPEWTKISTSNNCNREVGIEILQALKHYSQALYPQGKPESKIIAEHHSLSYADRPTSLDILTAYSRHETNCVVLDCCDGQAEIPNVGCVDVIHSFLERKTPRLPLCSVLRIPDASLSTEKGLQLPVHLREERGSTAYWRDNGSTSPWQYGLFPGAAIMYPHVETWTSASFTSQISGKTLWLLWPGTLENYRVLYSNTFLGVDHRLAPLYAIQHMTGLETLLVSVDPDQKSADQPSWVTTAGTIRCILNFSRLASHGGFYIYHTGWWQSAVEASSNMLPMLRSAPRTADTNAKMYLEEMLYSMVVWERLVGETENKEGAKELGSWVQKTKTDIENIIEARRPSWLPLHCIKRLDTLS